MRVTTIALLAALAFAAPASAQARSAPRSRTSRTR